jgi:histidinol-phosphate aminotransferase
VNRFWSNHVNDLVPYTPGEQPATTTGTLLKLNTNENPYGPSPKAIEAIHAATGDRLRLYPSYSAQPLREAVASLNHIDADQVFVGNGSDEILAHIFDALFRKPGRRLLMPDISYSFYKTYCLLYQVPAELVPLTDDYAIDPDDYCASRATPPAGIIFANPNAPTGMAIGLDDIERIAGANPDCPVVVDEAYVDFGTDSAVGLLGRCDNIVVVQTLSKSRSLAGLRVGFAMAGSDIVQGLLRIKDSFNSYPLDQLAQVGARAAILDTDWFIQTRDKVVAARGELTRGLENLGFQVLPSAANFVFARHPQHDARAISSALRDENIMVRHFALPRIDQFLRITVGTTDDCRRLCRVLARFLDVA